jgi:ATP-dependent Clp protease adaptor protein ClpS
MVVPWMSLAAGNSTMRPSFVSTPDIAERTWLQSIVLPPWKVLLFNDEVHAIDEVVLALLSAVQSLSVEQAVAVTLEAHNTGVAVATTAPKERAEAIRERLESFGLTSTIEPDA